MTEFEHRLIQLMEEAKEELFRIGIEPSRRIIGIKENCRAKKRLGCCKKQMIRFREVFQIEISSMLKDADDKTVKEVILHELLHTCPGCFDHGLKWKKMASEVNHVYGYQIQRVSTVSVLAIQEQEKREYKYRICCIKCGYSSYRIRRSKVTESPEKYRCAKCGGALKVDQI